MATIYAVVRVNRNQVHGMSAWPNVEQAQAEADRLTADWDWNHTPAGWRDARERHFNDVRSEMGVPYDSTTKRAIDAEADRRTVAEKGPKPKPSREDEAEFAVLAMPLVNVHLMK